MEKKKKREELKQVKKIEKQRKRELKENVKIEKMLQTTYKRLQSTLNVKKYSQRKKRVIPEVFTSKDAKNNALVIEMLRKRGRKPKNFYKILLHDY